MNVLLILIPVSLVLLLAAIGFFAWAVRSDQFDDLDVAALDILRDDPAPRRAIPTAPGASDAD